MPSAPPRARAPDYDLSGIDLDVESPDRLFPPGTAPAARPEVARPARPKDEAPNKPPVKPEPAAPPPMKPPAEDLLQPRAGAAEEAGRLVELGIRAFRDQEYGVAAWRFRQASEVHPANARAFFLLGQAYLAV